MLENLAGEWHGSGFSPSEGIHYIGTLRIERRAAGACLVITEALCPTPSSRTLPLRSDEHEALCQSDTRYEDCSVLYFDTNQQTWMVNQYLPDSGVLNKVAIIEDAEMRWWGGPKQHAVRFILSTENKLRLTVGEPVLIEMLYKRAQ